MKYVLVILLNLVVAGLYAQFQGTNPTYYNTAGGRVGIGTSTPQKKLDVLTGSNDFVSFGETITTGNYSGIHFGYMEFVSTAYRKSALVFERTDNAARGKIHFLNNNGNDNTSATLADSKMTIEAAGNVGIGNSSPPSLLTLNKSGSGAQTSEVMLQSNGINVAKFGWNASGYMDISALYSNNNLIISPAGTGNVGIGTTSPGSLLTLNRMGSGAQSSEMTLQSNNLGVARFGWNAGGYMDISTLYNNNHIVFSPNGTGNVGIGTTSPDAKLAVKGSVHAQEVKVDLTVPGPDYVFEKDYSLPSLESVKTYIDQNKHLPEVPSAKEMEANGINLSEMNMLLLKKVEELTLYVIEQQKQIDELKKNVNNK